MSAERSRFGRGSNGPVPGSRMDLLKRRILREHKIDRAPVAGVKRPTRDQERRARRGHKPEKRTRGHWRVFGKYNDRVWEPD